jgi:hypothetical protein
VLTEFGSSKLKKQYKNTKSMTDIFCEWNIIRIAKRVMLKKKQKGRDGEGV